jgi:hypothetical protein
MSKNYVMVSAEKEERARMAIVREGKNSFGEVPYLAEAKLYRRGLEEGLKDEDLVLYIYRALGGLVKEFDVPEQAVEYKEKLVKIRSKKRPSTG